MAIDFPTSPSVNQQYSYNGRTWKWNGYAWILDVNYTANAAFDKANTATYIANLAFDTANSANATTGVSATTYGGATQIGVFTVNTRGKITSAANVAFSGMDYAYVNAFTKNTNSNLFIGGQRASINVVSSVSNTFTPSFSSNNFFSITLANNETLANATTDSSTLGQSGAIFVIQAAAGSKTLSFGLAYKFSGNTPPTITTTANAVDMIVYTVRKANSYICDIVQNVGNFNDT
jgi:hypothetical protein